MDIVEHRIKRAFDSLREARILADEECWNTAINRLYYACFYAVSAILKTRGLHSSKHSGVRSLFNQHFVRTGHVSSEAANVYNELFDTRNDADYDDFFESDKAQVTVFISEVKIFVKTIERVIAET